MDNATKIRRVSTVLIYASYFVMAFWAIFIYATLYNIYVGRDALDEYLNDILIPTLTRMGESDLIVSIPAAVIYFAPTTVWIYGFWRLAKLFKLFKKGVYFSDEGANHLFVFASLACLIYVFQTPLRGVADWVLTLGSDLKPYGMPLLINFDEGSDLILLMTFLTVSWVLREAIKIAKENAEFV